MTNGISPLLPLGDVTPEAPTTLQVDVTVGGLKSSDKMLGLVFADASSFVARQNAVARFVVEPKGQPVVRATITVPPGRYAIAVFQDTKGTGRVETGLFGQPIVPYGFSNDASGKRGPPAFDAAAFTVGSVPKSLSIRLR